MRAKKHNIKRRIKKRFDLEYKNFEKKSNNNLKVNVNKVVLNEKYERKENVDYNTIIYISSYERYNKLIRILDSLFNQKTKYSFKIIVMNDGSKDVKYDSLIDLYPNIDYLKNKENGGKNYYWRTINTIFNKIKEYSSDAVIQIDDDFILCENFIDKLMNLFFDLKREKNTYMGIRYHIPSFKKDEEITDDYFNPDKYFQGFDGGSLFDVTFLEMFDYTLPEIKQDVFKHKFQHSHVWSTLNNLIIKFGAEVYRTRESFAFHDGNDDSKMHSNIRKNKKIYTKRFNGK